MTPEKIDECIRLLRAADDILMDHGEYLAAAHITMAIEILDLPTRATDQASPNTRAKIVSIRAK